MDFVLYTVGTTFLYIIHRNCKLKTVSCLRHLVASLSAQKLCFDPQPVLVSFVVDKVTLGQEVSLSIFVLPLK
jgi:hypothetical protein